MIRINREYISRFKFYRYEYLYPISKGIWLAFDKDTLEYIGVELFYQPKTTYYLKQSDELVETLINKNILEMI